MSGKLLDSYGYTKYLSILTFKHTTALTRHAVLSHVRNKKCNLLRRESSVCESKINPVDNQQTCISHI